MTKVLQNVALGVLFFSVLMFSFFAYFNNVADTHGFVPSVDTNNTFNKLNITINKTRAVADQIDKSEQETEVGVIDSLFRNSFSGLLLLWDMFAVGGDLIDITLTSIGIPQIIISAIVSALLIVTLVSILLTVLRRA